MYSNTAISIQNVSKKFRLFSSQKERLLEALHPFRKRFHREFWALRNVDFSVRRGEVVGILGKNGSGKSTLLQIVCAVMKATEGEVKVIGKISALLELGAGFNPEFSGRDNVLLNGAIMGISRKEMLRRLPEIEAFADIGEFFHQPVKTYSSGMFVRAAFAAAIHVDPDVLVVDEALAVGDAKFQRKCLLQIEKIRSRGAAILFVSHSLDTIMSLCSRAIILENGRLLAEGDPKTVVETYLGILFSEPGTESKVNYRHEDLGKDSTIQNDQKNELSQHRFFDVNAKCTRELLPQRFGYNRHELRTTNGCAKIEDYLVVVDGRTDIASVSSGSAVTIFLKVKFLEDIIQPIVGFDLKTDKGVTISSSNTFLAKAILLPATSGDTRIYQIEFNTPLNEGDYFIDLGLAKYDGSPGGHILDVRRSIIHLLINPMEQKSFNGILDLGFRFAEVDR